ncbi:MAG TPA: LacI family DNA-binding transcriptional regulator [Dongiaceae bacterium]
MATIKDVAREAQVSTATVSATLNSSAYVSPDLRARVLAAVDRLGYAPSAIAQSLKKGRTGLLALVVADVTNPFFMNLIHAVETAADAWGYSLMLCNSDEKFEREQQHLRRIRARRCDGLILAPTGDPDSYRIGDPAFFAGPTVLIDRVIDDWPADSVSIDNMAAAIQATNYILDLGHRRIGAVTGPRHVSTGADRHAGFMQALASRGIAVNPQHIRSGDYREDRAYSVAREILRLPDRPTAFFVANNLMLIGVMRAISEAGLNCPADISVVSMDDFMWVNAFRPRLTTVSQPMAEMGAEAVRLLVERLTAASGEPPRRVVMQPTLIVRESCAPYHA